jgi:hypothetical protein
MRKWLLILPVIIAVMIPGSALLKHHLENQERYQYHDYSECGPGGFAYLEASAQRGDPGSQHLLQQLREKCREQS